MGWLNNLEILARSSSVEITGDRPSGGVNGPSLHSLRPMIEGDNSVSRNRNPFLLEHLTDAGHHLLIDQPLLTRPEFYVES